MKKQLIWTNSNQKWEIKPLCIGLEFVKHCTDAFRCLGSSFKQWIFCFSVNFSAFSMVQMTLFIEGTAHNSNTSSKRHSSFWKQKSSSSFMLLFMGDECKSTPLWKVKTNLIPVKLLDFMRRGQPFTSKTHILNIWSCFWPTFPEKQMRGRFRHGCQSDRFPQTWIFKERLFYEVFYERRSPTKDIQTHGDQWLRTEPACVLLLRLYFCCSTPSATNKGSTVALIRLRGGRRLVWLMACGSMLGSVACLRSQRRVKKLF